MTDTTIPPVSTVGIIGGGTMGVGIAYVFAEAGASVTVVEPDHDRARLVTTTVTARAGQRHTAGKLEPARAQHIRDSVTVVDSIEALPVDLDLIVEAVPEDLGLKHMVLKRAQDREPVLLASNTSSIGIASMATVLRRPQSFLGLHFFNPVWSMPLLEIIRGADTADDVVDAARTIGEFVGKESIVVRDVPGFATSRLGVAIGLEAMRMLEDGVASADDIDRAMVLGYRHPMGPLRLTDLVGLDVRLGIARALSETLGGRFSPPKVLMDMVEQGRLGKKSGRGFFDWTPS